MIYLTLILAVWVGYYLREVLDTLKTLVERVEAIRSPEKAKPQQPASFGDVMTKAEVVAMIEQERIEAMNER